jgi:hypothetical protein
LTARSCRLRDEFFWKIEDELGDQQGSRC